MKSFFHNALGFDETDGGLAPLRFTPEQMAFFDPLPWKFRSYNAAGIRLDFMTDSPYVRVAYRVEFKPGTTELLLFDIYVDDVLTAFPGQTFTEQGSGEWTAQLPIQPGQPRRVAIYLPYLAKVIIDELDVADDAVLEPVASSKKRLLCLGDSITQGMNAAHPSSTYAILLSRFLDMELLNQAISGYFFDERTIDPNLPYTPDLVTVAYGTNDWSMCESYDQFKQQASRYLRKLTEVYPSVPVAVLTPIWRTDYREERKVGAFRDLHRTLESLCQEHSTMQVIDGLTLVPHHADFFADGLHPTDHGFMHMAMNLLKQLKDKRLTTVFQTGAFTVAESDKV